MSPLFSFHGGRLSEARRQFGGKASDWIDLSTGINPNPWMPPDDMVVDWRALPDPDALGRLEHAAAGHFGGNPALCAAVPGSEAGLRAVAQLLDLPGRHLELSYSTHASAFAQAQTIAGPEDPIGTPSVLVLGNPNNPDGALVPREAVLAALERQERSGGWLIVDEAFADCAPGSSVADQVADDRRLIVTRSFGKFFGLAGVRLGFVLAPSGLLAQLRHLQGEWPVCSAALAYGIAAYEDSRWIAQTRRELAIASMRLDEVLVRHGLAPRGNCPLFRLAEVEAAQDVFAVLAHRQILTRPFSGHPRLLRFGLPGSPDALARVDTALAAAVQNDG